MMELLSDQGKHPWLVRLQFTVSESYPYGPEKPGDPVQWSMMGVPVKSGLRHYVQFELFTCYCEAQQVVVQRQPPRHAHSHPHSTSGFSTCTLRFQASATNLV